MDTTSLRALLGRIGLDERECEVYLTLLALKSARATDIAKRAKQSRSHTYLVLRSLEARGLISEVERGNVLEFSVAPPERLVTYLKDREKELQALQKLTESALPQLKALTGPMVQIPKVTLLHGIDGMKHIYREIFPHSFCALFNAEKMYATFGSGIPQLILDKNESLLGRDLLVDNDGAKRFIKENPQNDQYEIRLFPKGVTFDTDAMVFGDVLVLFSYDSEHTLIRIENASIANSFRAWFDLLWKDARKV